MGSRIRVSGDPVQVLLTSNEHQNRIQILFPLYSDKDVFRGLSLGTDGSVNTVSKELATGKPGKRK